LRGRSPIMINSNYYGLVCLNTKNCNLFLFKDSFNPGATHLQSARAANCVYAALLFRRQVERAEISPVYQI
jgi:hypothetical protein